MGKGGGGEAGEQHIGQGDVAQGRDDDERLLEEAAGVGRIGGLAEEGVCEQEGLGAVWARDAEGVEGVLVGGGDGGGIGHGVEADGVLLVGGEGVGGEAALDDVALVNVEGNDEEGGEPWLRGWGWGRRGWAVAKRPEVEGEVWGQGDGRGGMMAGLSDAQRAHGAAA